jgi:hypothetical protein
MSGAVAGSVRMVLRLEGPYSKFDLDWETFALFFFTPDLSFLDYLLGPKVGAITYNLAHSYIGAVGRIAIALLRPEPIVLCASLIWCAHIGFDRALGYGLKYSDGFSFTHLGRIGRIPVVTPTTS